MGRATRSRLVNELYKKTKTGGPIILTEGSRVRIPANVPSAGDPEEVGTITRLWSNGMVEFRADPEYWAEEESQEPEIAGFRDYHMDLLELALPTQREKEEPTLTFAFWNPVAGGEWVSELEVSCLMALEDAACEIKTNRHLEPDEGETVGIVYHERDEKWVITRTYIAL